MFLRPFSGTSCCTLVKEQRENKKDFKFRYSTNYLQIEKHARQYMYLSLRKCNSPF